MWCVDSKDNIYYKDGITKNEESFLNPFFRPSIRRPYGWDEWDGPCATSPVGFSQIHWSLAFHLLLFPTGRDFRSWILRTIVLREAMGPVENLSPPDTSSQLLEENRPKSSHLRKEMYLEMTDPAFRDWRIFLNLFSRY